jgi:hypothetical protein
MSRKIRGRRDDSAAARLSGRRDPTWLNPKPASTQPRRLRYLKALVVHSIPNPASAIAALLGVLATSTLSVTIRHVRLVPTRRHRLGTKKAANWGRSLQFLTRCFVTSTPGCCNTIRFQSFSNRLSVRLPCTRRRFSSGLRFYTLTIALANQTRSIRAKARCLT